MSVLELKAAFKGIEGSEHLTVSYAPNGNQLIHIGDKTLEVGPMASNAEIEAALQNPFIRTENTKMSISGYEPGAIRAKLDALKKQGKDRRDQAIAKLDAAGTKHEEVSAEIERVAGQIEKEADAALQEFAEFSNGGPA
jgi:DNA anti-recombination protein RmuC